MTLDDSPGQHQIDDCHRPNQIDENREPVAERVVIAIELVTLDLISPDLNAAMPKQKTIKNKDTMTILAARYFGMIIESKPPEPSSTPGTGGNFTEFAKQSGQVSTGRSTAAIGGRL
jgi:hypothetical protein